MFNRWVELALFHDTALFSQAVSKLEAAGIPYKVKDQSIGPKDRRTVPPVSTPCSKSTSKRRILTAPATPSANPHHTERPPQDQRRPFYCPVG